MKIQEALIFTAYKYLNTKEIPDNRGWFNKAFQKVMENVGWRMGQHWCAYFMELVWKEAYKTVYYKTALMGADRYFLNSFEHEWLKIDKILNKLCSGNSQATFRNFKNSNIFETGTIPALGAAVIWKYSGTAGHTAACVVEITDKGFYSVEGNSKNNVTKNYHPIDESHRVGFIYPKEF